MQNVELYILSITRMNKGLEEKNKYNFKKDSVSLKYEFVKQIKRDDSQIIIIDDDPSILKKLKDGFDDVILLKDTTLVD